MTTRFQNIDLEHILELDKESPIPLYHQLCDGLRSVIEALGPEKQMPSETELVELTGVSRQTVRRAISELVIKGVLRSEQGKGTYTSRPRAETQLKRLAGFTESMRDAGRSPSTKLVSIGLTNVEREVAVRLGLESTEKVWEILRLRHLESDPVMLERARVPERHFPALDSHDLNQSMYDIMRDEYHMEPHTGSESIWATSAEGDVANLLDVSAGLALILTHRLTLTSDGVAIEDTIRHARADACSFRVDLTSGATMTDASLLPELLDHAGAEGNRAK